MSKKTEQAKERIQEYRDRTIIVRIPREQAHLLGAFSEGSDLVNKEMALKIREHFGIIVTRKKSVSQLRLKLIEKLTEAKSVDSGGNSDYENWNMYKLKSAFVQSQLKPE